MHARAAPWIALHATFGHTLPYYVVSVHLAPHRVMPFLISGILNDVRASARRTRVQRDRKVPMWSATGERHHTRCGKRPPETLRAAHPATREPCQWRTIAGELVFLRGWRSAPTDDSAWRGDGWGGGRAGRSGPCGDGPHGRWSSLPSSPVCVLGVLQVGGSHLVSSRCVCQTDGRRGRLGCRGNTPTLTAAVGPTVPAGRCVSPLLPLFLLGVFWAGTATTPFQVVHAEPMGDVSWSRRRTAPTTATPTNVQFVRTRREGRACSTGGGHHRRGALPPPRVSFRDERGGVGRSPETRYEG